LSKQKGVILLWIEQKGDNTMEKYIVKLTQEERESLLLYIRKGKMAAYKLTHARILLAVDEGRHCADKKTDVEISKQLHVGVRTLERLRKRCVEEGIESALLRKAHSRSKPKKIMGEEEARLIALCCSNPPKGRARWTLKLLSDELVNLEIVESVSTTTVGRVLKKMN
jgi:transposase